MITNRSASPVIDLSLKDTYTLSDVYRFAEGSATLFYNGKKHLLKASADGKKITLEGIFVPPRESVFVFYRLIRS